MAWTVCVHGGQGCVMLTRMLLPRSRYDEGIAAMEEGFRTMAYGDPTDASNLQGPQISAAQRQRVLDIIESGVDEGARVVVGGGRPAHLDRGFYVEPTLIADVDNSMRIAQEEIFGPVLVVVPFEDDDDAVRIANENQYGLGCGVTSGSEERALSVARRIRAGTASVNGGGVVRSRCPLWWLQGQRRRQAERAGGIRAVHGDQDDRRRVATTIPIVRTRTVRSSKRPPSKRRTQ